MLQLQQGVHLRLPFLSHCGCQGLTSVCSHLLGASLSAEQLPGLSAALGPILPSPSSQSSTALRPSWDCSLLFEKISMRLHSFLYLAFLHNFNFWSCAYSFFLICVDLNLTKVKTSKERLEAEKRTKSDFKFGNFLIQHPLKIIENYYIAKCTFVFSESLFNCGKNKINERREILVTFPLLSTVMKTIEAKFSVLHHQEQGSFFFFSAINLGVSVPGSFTILLFIQKYLP